MWLKMFNVFDFCPIKNIIQNGRWHQFIVLKLLKWENTAHFYPFRQNYTSKFRPEYYYFFMQKKRVSWSEDYCWGAGLQGQGPATVCSIPPRGFGLSAWPLDSEPKQKWPLTSRPDQGWRKGFVVCSQKTQGDRVIDSGAPLFCCWNWPKDSHHQASVTLPHLLFPPHHRTSLTPNPPGLTLFQTLPWLILALEVISINPIWMFFSSDFRPKKEVPCQASGL